MSHDLVQKRTIFSTFSNAPNGGIEDTVTDADIGPVDLNATGDKFGFAPAVNPVEIYRYGVITAVAMDPDAGGFVLSLDFRPTAGSDTNRVERDTLTRADAQTVAAGRVLYRDVIIPVAQAAGDDTLTGGVTPQTSVVNVGPSGPLRVRPGEEVILEVTNAVGAASTGRLFIEYAELGVSKPNTAVGSDGEFLVRDITGQ